MADFNRQRDEAFTEQHFSQMDRVTQDGGARMLLCFCIDISRSMSLILDGYREGIDFRYVNSAARSQDGVSNVRSVQALPGRSLMTRLTKLTDILCRMIRELKRQRDIADSVTICITTFSQYADVIQEFQDVRDISETYISRRLKLGASSTNMAQGLAFAEREIRNQKNLLRQAQIDACTPMLVVMSDGLPTDESEADRKREELRYQDDEGHLSVVPVFIGGKGDYSSQRFLKGLTRDETLYTMNTDREYEKFFDIIRNAIDNFGAFTVADIPEQMAQSVETSSDDAIDTTYGIDTNTISSKDEGSTTDVWDWED